MDKKLPSKKQQELLRFVDGFIKGNGYGPSYREIQKALGYKSVSTVAVHIDGLVTKGLLAKTGEYRARSVELVVENKTNPDLIGLGWLKQQEKKLRAAQKVDEADCLVKAITILDQKSS